MEGKKELVCKMKRSPYGIKKYPRMWYQNFDTYILGLGFSIYNVDHCVYLMIVVDHFTYMVLCVDDILLVGNNKKIIKDVKSQLSSKILYETSW